MSKAVDAETVGERLRVLGDVLNALQCQVPQGGGKPARISIARINATHEAMIREAWAAVSKHLGPVQIKIDRPFYLHSDERRVVCRWAPEGKGGKR